MAVRLHNIIFNSMLAILLSALFVSCKDEVEENINGSQSKGGVIGFNAFQDGFQKPTTRAVIDKIDQLNEIYVLSMKQKAPGNWEQVFKNDAGTGIDVLTLSNSGNLIWDYSPVENWEDGYSYKFRAFYPQTFNTGAGESCTNGFEYAKPLNGSTTLTLNNYKSAQDPRNNTDLLVSKEVTRAYTTAEGNDEPVPLKMEHLLSCVNFNIKKKAGTELTISSFRIQDVIYKGNCTIDDNTEWKVQKEYDGKTYKIEDISDQFDFYDEKGELLNPPGSRDITKIPGQLKKHTGLSIVIRTEDNVSNDGDSFQSDVISESYLSDFLFIPQSLNGEDEIITILDNKGNKLEDNKGNTEFVIKHEVSVLLDYKYADDIESHQAVVNLRIPGIVESWEPGKKYNYTIGIYEYQATANITIEDWKHHTYEEELK